MARLVDHSPHIAAQFHPTLNVGIDLNRLTHGSQKKIWWVGECSHEWQAVVGNRTSKNGTGCPYCVGGFPLAGFNDLATTHPELAAQWDYQKNYPLLPSEVTAGNHTKVHWIGQCGHEWTADLASRALTGRGCPYCTGQKVLPGFNDLASLFPELAKEWHPSKNALRVTEISSKSNRKVWWLGECGHEWDAVVNKRTHSGRGCPYCSGNKILLGFNDLATTHPLIAKDLVPELNEGTTAQQISLGSKKNIWWKCPQGHQHQSVAYEKAQYSNGCPVCSGRKVLQGFNDLKTLHPHLAEEWEETLNDTLKITDVSAGSGIKIWWKCTQEHVWQAPIHNRVKRGDGCPLCSNLVSKGEQEIADFVKSLGLYVVQSDRKSLKGIELDIYIPEKNFAIEFNGLYWHSELRKTDNLYHNKKWNNARTQGIHLIQIWEDDWKNKPEAIKNMLRHKLGKVLPKDKLYARNLRVENISKKISQDFFEENTTYKFTPGTCYYGLLDGGENLHAVMIHRQISTGVSEVRYITGKNILGGFSKLLKHTAKIENAKILLATSDNCVSSGELYAKNGFIIEKELQPEYRYVVFGKKVKLWDAGSIVWKKEIG